jgi:hypothetical protein
MSDFFSDENIPQANWMKFTNVGDTVKGTFISKIFKEGQNNMPDQEVFELANVEVNGVKQDGNYNVPIKASNSFVLNRVKSVKVGQIIGFKYSADIESKVKGNHPAKSITPYLGGMDETYKVAESFGGTPTDEISF